MRIYREILAFLALNMFVVAAHATPMLETAPCVNDSSKICVIGVSNLVSAGNVYDVAFTEDAFIDVVARTNHAFLGDRSQAFLSIFSLVQPLINAGSSISGIIGVPPGPSSSSVLVPFEYDEETVRSWGIFYSEPLPGGQPWEAFYGYSLSTSTQFSYSGEGRNSFTAYAIFTQSVPVPSTFLLIVLGLLGVGAKRSGALNRQQN